MEALSISIPNNKCKFWRDYTACLQLTVHFKDSRLLALRGGLEKAMVTGGCCVGPDCCTEPDCVSCQTGYLKVSVINYEHPRLYQRLQRNLQPLPFKRDLFKLRLSHVFNHLLLRATTAKISTPSGNNEIFCESLSRQVEIAVFSQS